MGSNNVFSMGGLSGKVAWLASIVSLSSAPAIAREWDGVSVRCSSPDVLTMKLPGAGPRRTPHSYPALRPAERNAVRMFAENLFGANRRPSQAAIPVVWYRNVGLGVQQRQGGRWPAAELQSLASTCALSDAASLVSPTLGRFGLVEITCSGAQAPWNSMRLAVRLDHDNTGEACLNVGDPTLITDERTPAVGSPPMQAHHG